MLTFLGKIRLTRGKIAMFLLISLLIQLAMSYKLKGFEGDLKYWGIWMDSLERYQLAGVYRHDASVNYPPVFLSLLWAYRSIYQAPAGMFSLKLPVILIEFLTLAIVLVGFKKLGWTAKRHRFLVLYLLFSPVVLYISSVWGQVDFVHSSLMCLSLAALPAFPAVSGFLFGLALLTKLQAVVAAPVFAVYLFRRLTASDGRSVVRYAAGFCAPWLVFILYFSVHHSFGSFIRHAYLDAVGYYPYVSLYAANIWFNLIGVAPDTADTGFLLPGLTYRAFGLLLLGLFTLFTLLYMSVFRPLREIHLLKAGFLLSFAFYMLPTEIHDRYIIPAVILGIFIAFLERRRIWFLLMLAMELNTVVTLTIFLKKSKYPWLEQWGTPAAAVFLALFLVTVALCVREIVQVRSRSGLGENRGERPEAA